MSDVRLGVLGPIAAHRVGDGPLDLGGPLQRTVLAVLVAAGGRPVSAADLIDEIWGDPAATAGATSLPSYLSRLRRSLERDGSTVIERIGGGYALRLPSASLDAERFVSLAAEGQRELGDGNPAAARAALAEGLALWRGAAYDDVVTGPRIAAAVARLEELRRCAEESLLLSRLDLGEADAVVAEAEQLVRRDQSGERLWEILARALYQCGRQADALDALRRARRELRDAFGLDPGPRLQELEVAILRHDPALGRAVRAAAPPEAAGQVRVRPPLPLTSFVGRRAELGRLAALADARLVTLLGSGGIGKTRLALAAVHDLPRGDREVAWVALGPVREGAQVGQAVADALGVGGHGGPVGVEAVVPALRGRRILIVLDNCEHLVDAAAGIAARLLEACPGVQVLATSREELRVPGEVILDVRPLAVGGDAVSPGEAYELFCARAAPYVDEADLRGGSRALVERICEELDGVPLAIELAAARLRHRSLPELVTALEDRFTLLSNGPRTGPTHHRTLRDTVAWSYELLPPEEQEAFRRLAVLDGFCFEDGVRLLGRADGARLLHELAAKSMLVVDRDRDEPRWNMLETLRVFAAEVTDREESDETHARMLDWAVELAATASSHEWDAAAPHWLTRLDLEQANVRRALAWGSGHGRLEQTAALVAGMWWYWNRRGRTAEARTWFERALAGTPSTSALRVALLAGLTDILILDGDADAARTSAEALELVTDDTDPGLRSRLWVLEGCVRAGRDDIPGSVEALRQAVLVAASSGRPTAEAHALIVLGHFVRDVDISEAEGALGRAVGLAFAADAPWLGLSAQWVASKLQLSTGHPADAARLSAEVMVGMARQRDDTAVMGALQSLAGAVAAAGDGPLGAALLGACDAIGEGMGWSPVHLDTDSRWIRELVTAASDEATYAKSYAGGASLGMAEVLGVAARFVSAPQGATGDAPSSERPGLRVVRAV